MNISEELIKRGAYQTMVVKLGVYNSAVNCFVLNCVIGYIYVLEDNPNELVVAFYDMNMAGFYLNPGMATQIDSIISLLGGVK